MRWKIPLFKLNYDKKENKAVEQVLRGKWLSMGNKTQELEEKFNAYFGNGSKSVAVSSCTAAIHISLLAAGITHGDEVIVPSLSFVAQLNIIKNLGAKAILIDCKSFEDWNMNTNQILKKITVRTKAIIILHYAGYPNLISKELIKVSKERKIRIIEDVAHAPGAKIQEKYCGTFGDFGCFSFFSNKNISAGEGGMVVVKNLNDYNKVKALRSHGMNKLSIDKTNTKTFTYNVLEFGLNYRIDELRSALALEQFKKLNVSNLIRKRKVKIYIDNLKDTKFIIPFQHITRNFKCAYHIFVIMLPKGCNRKKLVSYLQDYGIQTSVHYPKFWGFSKYNNEFDKTKYPVCDVIANRALTLPLFTEIKDKEILYICKKLRSFINE